MSNINRCRFWCEDNPIPECWRLALKVLRLGAVECDWEEFASFELFDIYLHLRIDAEFGINLIRHSNLICLNRRTNNMARIWWHSHHLPSFHKRNWTRIKTNLLQLTVQLHDSFVTFLMLKITSTRHRPKQKKSSDSHLAYDRNTNRENGQRQTSRWLPEKKNFFPNFLLCKIPKYFHFYFGALVIKHIDQASPTGGSHREYANQNRCRTINAHNLC